MTGRPASGSVRAVLFDFNGTLSNDEPLVYAAYRAMCMSCLNWPLTRDFYDAHLVGRSDDEMIEAILRQAGGRRPSRKDLLDERHRQYVRRVRQASPIRESTAAFVRGLLRAGTQMGIVSGAERRDIDLVLDLGELRGVFGVIVSQEDVVHHKPDPEGYLLAMSKMGVQPRHTIVFEDSLVGIQAAKAAGISCIAVEGSHPNDVLADVADLVVPEIAPELLRAMALRPGTK
jgi:beta-phosphoglucomutase